MKFSTRKEEASVNLPTYICATKISSRAKLFFNLFILFYFSIYLTANVQF